MNKFIYISILLILFSCKSKSIAQGQKKGISKSDPIKTNQIAPNTIHFYGEVLDVFKNKSVCGKIYKKAMEVKVKKIIGTGSGIVNMISPQQEILLKLPSNTSDEKSLKEKFKDKELMFVVLEGLCMDISQTGYEIINFDSKN